MKISDTASGRPVAIASNPNETMLQTIAESVKVIERCLQQQVQQTNKQDPGRAQVTQEAASDTDISQAVNKQDSDNESKTHSESLPTVSDSLATATTCLLGQMDELRTELSQFKETSARDLSELRFDLTRAIQNLGNRQLTTDVGVPQLGTQKMNGTQAISELTIEKFDLCTRLYLLGQKNAEQNKILADFRKANAMQNDEIHSLRDQLAKAVDEASWLRSALEQAHKLASSGGEDLDALVEHNGSTFSWW